MTDIIAAIDTLQQARAIVETQRYIDQASRLFQQNFPAIEVLFDLKGRAAGMYRVRRCGSRRQRQIRYNPWLFAKYWNDNFGNTIPHEVAHYIADLVYGADNIRPHGEEWKAIMGHFGATPNIRADYDLTGTPQRRNRYYRYRCRCGEVKLTAYRHNRIVRGQRRYFCRDCRQPLRMIPATTVEPKKRS